MNAPNRPDPIDFYPHGCGYPPPICGPELPNGGRLGVVTIGPSTPGRLDGEFISSRLLTQEELAVEWAQHRAGAT